MNPYPAFLTLTGKMAAARLVKFLASRRANIRKILVMCDVGWMWMLFPVSVRNALYNRVLQLFCGLALFSASLYGDAFTWSVTGGGSWEEGMNWGRFDFTYPQFSFDSATLGNSITGPSTVTLSAPIDIDTITFSGDENYLVTGSTITFYTGITVQSGGSGSHTLASNASLEGEFFITQSNASQDFTISGVISSGLFGLEKLGVGNLVLSGTNTYSGTTAIRGGTITISSNANLGGGSSLIFISSGGTLHITTNDFTLPKNITLLAAGTINIDDDRTITMSGSLGGSAPFTKSGAGTLILAGSHTHSGTKTVSAGTLQGTTTTLQGNITNNANVVFDQSVNGTYSGSMSGSGALTKSGTGLVTLSGTNTYMGGTTVAAGELQGTTSSLQGDIVNNGTLIFDQSMDGEYSGAISSTGTVTKSGSGKLIMSGTNTYSGITTVSAGELQVTGALASAPTVEANTTLSGTGTVGTTTNDGTVSPGTSIGTFTIDGDYTQGGGATLVIEINPDGTSDLLDISGMATLAGTLQLNPQPGVYVGGTSYTVLIADSISGTFDSFIEDNPFTFAPSYFATTVTITVIEPGTVLPVAIANLEGNAKAVAKYLFCDTLTYTGDLLNVTQNLTSLSATTFPQALNQLSPAQFGALPLVNLQNDTRMATPFVEYVAKHARCRANKGAIIWAEPIAYYYRQDGVQRQIPFHAHTIGTAFGGTKAFANDLVFSGGGGYTHSNLYWKESAGKGSWSTIYACPSFGWIPRNYYINGLALFACNFYDIDRNISFGTIDRTAHNDHSSFDILVRTDAGAKFQVTKNGFFLQPELRLSYLNVFENGYVETGAKSINLEVDKKHTAFFQPEFTVKWIKEWTTKTTCFSPCLYIGWLRNAPLLNGSYTSKFFSETTCKPSFTVESFYKTTDQLILGSELVISAAKSLFVLEYEANVGSNYQVQEGKIRFEWAF